VTTISVDMKALERLGNMLAAAGKRAPHAIRRGLNRTGDKARTQVKRALVVQTGLKSGTITRALKTRRASFGSLAYTMTTWGGDISLRYFNPRETRAGVSAAPGGKRQIFARTFMKGGRFPKRVDLELKLGGHVFKRTGKGRLPIEKQHSGMYIPEEMVSGASQAAFFAAAQGNLANDVARELFAILSGAAPRGR
jgi:hypothetical protein